MTLLTQSYEAGLVLGDDIEIGADQLIDPILGAMAMFGAGDAVTELRFDGAVLVTPSVTVEIEMSDVETEDGPALRIGLAVTQHDELVSDHPQAAAAMLVEMLHAGIEATGASHVVWQDALICTRTFQQAVPSVRHAATTDDAIADIMAEEEFEAEDDIAPQAEPILLPRRVRPATDHRACGTAINMKDFEARVASAKRMSQWESFDDYVDAEVAKIRTAPAAKALDEAADLAEIFRGEIELPPEVLAQMNRKPKIERRIATWTLTAAIAIAGLGLHEAVASTLQAFGH